ncbi:MAG: hypothetical protein ACREFP_04200, partial [Acetobacteraceae bacterium]
MKLTEFQITDYRSINDSGPVKIGKLTSLVGRNESGKSNVLLALWSLNPVGGIKPLNPIKDFPRHRRLSECSDDTKAVRTVWELNVEEQSELAQIFSRAAGVTQVEIGRSYKLGPWATFPDLKPLSFSLKEVAARVTKIVSAINTATEKLEDVPRKQTKEAVTKLATDLAGPDDADGWASVAAPSLAILRKALVAASISLGKQEDGLITEIEDLATNLKENGPAQKAAETWVLKKLPVFVYVADYPELTGHQNVADYLKRKASNPSTATDADRNFEKMCKVAGLDPQQLETLRSEHDHETRNQLANRAGAVVTSELRRLWKDR